MGKPATLTAGLVATKGEAKPAVVMPAASITRASNKDRGEQKALTLKLDRSRYTALKQFGIACDKTNQDILVEALDEYLAKHSQGI